MTDINNVVLAGRLVRDSELSYTGDGSPLLKFSLAVNESRKVGDKYQDDPSFFDMVIFGKYAQSMSQYLKKGKQVIVSGRIKQYRWQVEGQTRSRVSIIVREIELVGGKANG